MMGFSPILMRIGYGLSWQNAVVTAWGGLRGAVGLALALQVYIDQPLIGGKVRPLNFVVSWYIIFLFSDRFPEEVVPYYIHDISKRFADTGH